MTHWAPRMGDLLDTPLSLIGSCIVPFMWDNGSTLYTYNGPSLYTYILRIAIYFYIFVAFNYRWTFPVNTLYLTQVTTTMYR